ncbi:hypothetical protein CQ010_06285 [Arthrobacter sp. MYb211]|uniref:hypothetical protein n=1 Tax=Micrococcaceae TaxID=1268 RepID=UPI000CFC4597|nr:MULTISPECIES: hypothetical protein [unclassified Arthrobacter]PRA04525.1 hypothetical protein CQ019_09385 [Arthrobacter sp. MYb229]PRA12257.1 hypothetical protein CQ015_06980 [Arthrobacter sp. MYb221]PRB51562.1 hypothetical protein CQ013_07180 [Arthrobacter sp. MYb216]PRC08720.1 hypothetical protein CQ010_06285 [Arthrobacter sp. MYb211]
MRTDESIQNHGKPATELDIERQALWAGFICSILGLIVGLILFAGNRPALAGGLSVGAVAASTGAIAAALASAVAFRRLLLSREPWLARIPRWRQAVTLIGLVLVHAASSVMILMVAFHLMQQAFFGLRVDMLAGSLLVSGATGVSAYLCLVATARTNAETLSVVLGIFMASGVVISMLLAEDRGWWQSMFSSLGTYDAGIGSFWTFNTTLVVSGLVLMAFTEFMTRDLAKLARTYRCRPSLEKYRIAKYLRPRPGVVRWCLLAVAVGVILIGIVPVNVAPEVHATFVRLAAAGMMLLLMGTTVLLPGYPVVFHLMSLTALGALWLSFLLWQEWNYYNLTGFELAVVAILFTWISVFIRTTSALIHDKKQQLRKEKRARRRAQREQLAGAQDPAASNIDPHFNHGEIRRNGEDAGFQSR